MNYIANSVMKELWINTPKANGDIFEVNRNYLYQLLLNLEKQQYDNGYSHGYQNGCDNYNDRLIKHNDYKDVKVSWASLSNDFIKKE